MDDLSGTLHFRKPPNISRIRFRSQPGMTCPLFPQDIPAIIAPHHLVHASRHDHDGNITHENSNSWYQCIYHGSWEYDGIWFGYLAKWAKILEPEIATPAIPWSTLYGSIGLAYQSTYDPKPHWPKATLIGTHTPQYISCIHKVL